jgi:hypothetical protein
MNPVIREIEAIRAEQEGLKPCPFCGVGVHTEANGAVPGGRIVMHIGRPGCPLNQAYFRVEWWNRRAANPRKQAMRDLQRLGQEFDYPERLQVRDDEELWVNARNIMVAGSIAVVCIAAGLIGYAAGWV